MTSPPPPPANKASICLRSLGGRADAPATAATHGGALRGLEWGGCCTAPLQLTEVFGREGRREGGREEAGATATIQRGTLGGLDWKRQREIRKKERERNEREKEIGRSAFTSFNNIKCLDCWKHLATGQAALLCVACWLERHTHFPNPTGSDVPTVFAPQLQRRLPEENSYHCLTKNQITGEQRFLLRKFICDLFILNSILLQWQDKSRELEMGWVQRLTRTSFVSCRALVYHVACRGCPHDRYPTLVGFICSICQNLSSHARDRQIPISLKVNDSTATFNLARASLQSRVAEAPLEFSLHCLQPAAFCDSTSFVGSSAPAAVPFVSAQEGGEWGGAATAAARCREGRALALLHSTASYPSERVVVAAGGGVAVMIPAQEGISFVCTSV
ncbi:hypothetical protein E2320_002466 [Naja naja]|nr:hypothetical protein E2320_002466 [Naja naja]